MSSVGEGIGKSIGPLLIVGGLIAGAYLFRNQIAGWIRGLLPGKDDIGGAVEDGLGLAPGSIIGENGKSKDQICREQHGDNFIWNPWRGVCVNGWTGETPSGPIDTTVPGTTPGVITDAVNPSGNPVQTLTITTENMCDWEPWKSSNLCNKNYTAFGNKVLTQEEIEYNEAVRAREYSITNLMQERGTTREIAIAYLDNTYGLGYNDWRSKIWSSPEFAAKVGLPNMSYDAMYSAAVAAGGVYLGPNLNPDVPQNDPDYTTIYNPSSGAMWSGSSASTSYLMGDSPEAAAWRSRYL